MDQTLYYHPLADSDATADRMSRNIFISTFAEIQFPVEGLKFRTNFGYNYRNREIGEYYGRTTLTGQSTNGYQRLRAYREPELLGLYVGERLKLRPYFRQT